MEANEHRPRRPCDSKANSDVAGLEALGASHDPINFEKEIDAPERDDACTVEKTEIMKADNQGACTALAGALAQFEPEEKAVA